MSTMRPPIHADVAGPAGDHHLDDAELLRLADGERPLAPSADAHRRSCAACAARADLLRHRRVRLTRLLVDADAPAPAALDAEALLARAASRARVRRPLAHPLVRAAALLLAAGTLAAQPAVRAWVVARWHEVAGDARPATPAPPSPAAAQRPRASAVSFVPGDGAFTIHFDARPSGGSLTLVAGDDERATAERLDGASDELLVMPHLLRVRNDAASARRYRVVVPRSAMPVRVQIGGVERSVVLAAGETRTIVFDDDALPPRR